MKLNAKVRLQSSEVTASAMSKAIYKDKAALTKQKFEHGYNVKLRDDGSVFDKQHNELFATFDAWVKAMEGWDDEEDWDD